MFPIFSSEKHGFCLQNQLKKGEKTKLITFKFYNHVKSIRSKSERFYGKTDRQKSK